ncbi:myb and hsa domain protein [Ophiostoma piceae UAMH 11346]|uniref:Vacuolar import and degradation protein 21 n=1 Tax=Ophiostoma piceae (strain UAMH 11346) TaxID=1262450 RepID=S3C320_OPHP1|nr:myb and hsa domain protein [Ophiostoma piceae UAMH 11346]
MTEVGLADRLELLRQKRAEYSSIVRSRKRKLRELYAVATDGDGALNLNKFDVDAPPTKPGETKFLLDTDILQGRSLSDARIPTRHKPDLETLKQFFASATASSNRHETPLAPRLIAETPTPSTPSTQTHDVSRLDHDTGPHATSSRTPQPTPIIPNSNTVAKPLAARAPAPAPSPTVPKPEEDGSSDSTSRTSNPPSVPPSSDTPKSVDSTHNAESTAEPAARVASVTPSPSEQEKQAPAAQATPDAMDVDTELEQAKREDAATSTADQHAPNGTAKATDIPSSPESTVQTATTPAVHDISVNTSPENDTDSFVDRDEKTDRRQSQPKDLAHVDEPRDDTVEAQLLQESAAAVGSQADDKSLRTTTTSDHDQNGDKLATKTLAQADAEPKLLPSAMDVDEELPNKTESPSRPAAETASQARERTASTQPTTDGKLVAAESPSILAALPTPKPSTGDVNEKLHLSELVVANGRKDKRRAPTVLFGKQKKTKPDTTIVPSNLVKSDNLFAEDYFTPLFVQTFSQNAKWMKSMDQLVHHARKTLSSADNQASMFDTQSCKILKRIYHLQQQDKWSLRQPKRVTEPTRQKSHWDMVLEEMKWLRTDFRHERRWKMSHARILASACAAWTRAAPADRKRMQVNAVIPKRQEQHGQQVGQDDGMEDIPMIGNAMIDAAKGNDDAEARSSELEEIDMVDDGLYEDVDDEFVETISPSAIFALQEDVLVFELSASVASDRLLAELPMYSSPLQVPSADITAKDEDPDAAWRRPVVPVSKYIEAPIVIVKKPPPQKRSRFDLLDEPDEEVEEFVFGTADGSSKSRKAIAAAPDCIVGLFDPSFKSVRERIHTGHQFRPPSEYVMPLQSFYEHRPPSQWTVSDDDQLKKMVREYSYNWTLIASLMTKHSLYLSGAERRTSWECFERWVGLEGYPSDASRSPYFKIYQSRIDAAQRAIREANEKLAATAASAAAASTAAAAQASGGAGLNASAAPPTPTTLQRRRQTVPVRVEKHRNQKYYSMLEAIKRLTKKREANQTKQPSAPRKAEAPPAQRAPTKSPREYSKIRWDREQKLADKMAEFAQRQNEALRRQQMMARSQNQAMAAGGGVGGVPPQVAAQMAAANSMAMAGRSNMPGAAHGIPIAGQQPRPRIPIQNTANPIAGLPAHMAAAVGTPNPMAGLQPHQIQQMLQAQHRMQLANGTHPVGAGMNMATIAAGSPSPRPPMQQQLPPNIMHQIKELENGFRAKNPNLTPEQARSMAVQNYSHIMMMQRASAMHSASGGGPQQALAGTSPRQYAQLLRAQQAQQVQQAQQTGQHHVTQASQVAHAQAAQAAQAAHAAQAQAAASQAAQTAQLQAGSPMLAQQQAAQLARQAAGTPVPNGTPPAATK